MEAPLTETPTRPRNAADTRGRILDAARRRFARESYDDVGLRDIAGDVGVDAALISRYFGSKEDLFGEVLDSCGEGGPDWLAGPRCAFGRTLAHELVLDPPEHSDDKMEGLLIMLRSIGSARAAEVIRRSADERFYAPFVEWVGGPEAELRSRLALGVIMGMALSREITGGFNLADADARALCDRLSGILQSCVDGTAGDAPPPPAPTAES